VVSFSQGSLPKFCMHLSPHPYVIHAPPTSKIQSVPRSKHTPSQLYKPVS
jgi:hypothetical protein